MGSRITAWYLACSTSGVLPILLPLAINDGPHQLRQCNLGSRVLTWINWR